MCRQAFLALPARSDAPHRARGFLREHLLRWELIPSGCSALLDDAALALSELVTNAVRHGEGPLEVGIEHRDDMLYLRVRDSGERVIPMRPHPVAPTAVSGRGLLIISALSVAWGVVYERYGKSVWCRMAVDRTLEDGAMDGTAAVALSGGTVGSSGTVGSGGIVGSEGFRGVPGDLDGGSVRRDAGEVTPRRAAPRDGR